jgi:hypothetical protein
MSLKKNVVALFSLSIKALIYTDWSNTFISSISSHRGTLIVYHSLILTRYTRVINLESSFLPQPSTDANLQTHWILDTIFSSDWLIETSQRDNDKPCFYRPFSSCPGRWDRWDAKDCDSAPAPAFTKQVSRTEAATQPYIIQWLETSETIPITPRVVHSR